MAGCFQLSMILMIPNHCFIFLKLGNQSRTVNLKFYNNIFVKR